MTTANEPDQRFAETPQAGESDSFTVAYYFLPLERPLSLDDKTIIRSGQTPPIHEQGYEDDYFHIGWDDEQSRLVGYRVNCRIHQIPCPAIEMGQKAAQRAVVAAFPNAEYVDSSWPYPTTATMEDGGHVVTDIDGPESEPPLVTVTVAEVAVRIPNDSRSAVNDGLDVAVGFVANLQRVYSTVARQPMPTITRSRLPWALPYATRTVVHDETEPQWPTSDDIRYMLSHPLKGHWFIPTQGDANPVRCTIEDLDRAATPVLVGPFHHVHETWRSAGVAFQQDDLAVAAILLGVTCEQFIRALLLCLIWEYDTPSESAASLMNQKSGHTKNVSDLLNLLRSRLPVSPNRDKAAVSRARSVLDLRNRVLHRNYQPDSTDVQIATRGFEEFETWTRESLLARVERYPATCELALPTEVIDATQAALLDTVLTTTLRPTQPHENIQNYQIEIDRHLPGNESMRERKAVPDPAKEWLLMSLTYPSGAIRWFGLDESNWLAYVAKPPRNLNENQRQTLRESLEQTRIERDEFGDKPIVVVRWIQPGPEPQSRKPQLHSWFKISPIDRAERYASCPTPYIAPG